MHNLWLGGIFWSVVSHLKRGEYLSVISHVLQAIAKHINSEIIVSCLLIVSFKFMINWHSHCYILLYINMKHFYIQCRSVFIIICLFFSKQVNLMTYIVSVFIDYLPFNHYKIRMKTLILYMIFWTDICLNFPHGNIWWRLCKLNLIKICCLLQFFYPTIITFF